MTAALTQPGLREPDGEIRLIERILAGEQDAFDELLRPYLSRMQSFAYSVLRDRTDAEDAAQEAALKIYLHLGTFRRESSFSTWLFQITRNEIFQLRRKNVRRESRIQAASETGSAASDPEFRDPSPTPLDIAQKNDAMNHILRGLTHLPERFRKVLVLRDLEGLNTRDTAQRLGVPVNTVKIHLHRARRKLSEVCQRMGLLTPEQLAGRWPDSTAQAATEQA